MNTEVVELKWAPEPSPDRVEEVMQQVLAGQYKRNMLEVAIEKAKRGETDKDLCIQALYCAFNRLMSDSGHEVYYRFATEPLKGIAENNCAVLVNEDMEVWERRNPPPAEEAETKEYLVRRCVEMGAQWEFQRDQCKRALAKQRREAVAAWSDAVMKHICEERDLALHAVERITITKLRKLVASAVDGVERESERTFLSALLFHPQVFKLRAHLNASKHDDTRDKGATRVWLHSVCYQLTHDLEMGDRTFDRLFTIFGDFWDNTHLNFARDWAASVYLSYRDNYYSSTCHDYQYMPWSSRNEWPSREPYMIEMAVRNGNVKLLKAILAHPRVDAARVVCVLNMRLAAHVTYAMNNPYSHSSYTQYSVDKLSDEMCFYLFTWQLNKKALKPATMCLEPPPVEDVERYRASIGAMFGEEDADTTDSPHQLRLSMWNRVADQERTQWAKGRDAQDWRPHRTCAWAFLRQAVKRHFISWYIFEQLSRPNYRAEMDEANRPLMIGHIAARDEHGFHQGGHEGIAAAAAASRAPTEQSKAAAALPVDLDEARLLAAMQREFIASEEAETAAEKEAEKWAAIAAAEKAAPLPWSLGKRKARPSE